MPTQQRCSLKPLVFGASLRRGSLNDRLASLAADVEQEEGDRSRGIRARGSVSAMVFGGKTNGALV